jgi:hypothetical protein
MSDNKSLLSEKHLIKAIKHLKIKKFKPNHQSGIMELVQDRSV